MINQLKTVVLLALLTALLLFVGNLIGGYNGLLFAGVFVVIMNFGSYWFSDKIVLAMYRAKEVTDKTHPLYKIVKEVVELAKIPMPKVYIIPSESLNAFATGRSKNHAAVAATEGIVKALNHEELKGVMAHEITHVKNRDILISTIAGTVAGVISYIATMAQWAAIFGGRDRQNSNALSLIMLAIVTPIIATIIQLAISRNREYLADAGGANIVRNSNGLASALEKIHRSVATHPLRFGNQATAHLFILNPFKSSGLMNLLSTHPDVNSRIQKLKSMKF